eukprot:3839759-Rhodomonas_salina.1
MDSESGEYKWGVCLRVWREGEREEKRARGRDRHGHKELTRSKSLAWVSRYCCQASILGHAKTKTRKWITFKAKIKAEFAVLTHQRLSHDCCKEKQSGWKGAVRQKGGRE